MILKVADLGKRYGGVEALCHVTFGMKEGETVALRGGNGSGKTTCMELIGGYRRPSYGSVIFAGSRVRFPRAWTSWNRGLSRVWQHTISADTTIRDYVELGLVGRLCNTWKSVIGHAIVPVPRSTAANNLEQSLSGLGLLEKSGWRFDQCAHEDRRLAEFARATVTRPRLLLLDEPVAGLSEAGRALVLKACESLASAGTSLLVIDHDAAFCRAVTGRVIELDAGRVVADGSWPTEVRPTPSSCSVPGHTHATD